MTEQVCGAPPIIMNALDAGEIDAAISFWRFQAKMAAAGAREIIDVGRAALGLDPGTPLLGYVLQESREIPIWRGGLAIASWEAKRILVTDDAQWDRLRPIMNAESDAEFAAQREGWRAGTPGDAGRGPKGGVADVLGDGRAWRGRASCGSVSA